MLKFWVFLGKVSLFMCIKGEMHCNLITLTLLSQVGRVNV